LGFAFNTKLITLMANSKVLRHGNPLVGISEGTLLTLACVLEAAVMAAMFLLHRAATRSWITLWLCGTFLAYRAGMFAYPHSTCSCFGKLTDWIMVDDATLARIQIASLIYMAVGATACLLLERRSEHLTRESGAENVTV